MFKFASNNPSTRTQCVSFCKIRGKHFVKQLACEQLKFNPTNRTFSFNRVGIH